MCFFCVGGWRVGGGGLFDVNETEFDEMYAISDKWKY